jgi:ubiquinone/menaquinone biosynthesis C-methylase UbiE
MGFYSERLFPWMVEHSLDKPAIHVRRARLVGPAAGDVLEIGFGTGATLPFYDRSLVRSLSVVEPSAGMNMRATRRIREQGWDVRIDALAGESLPYPDASFDCVVSSLTLCSVTDPERVLGECWRVLRPGGTLRFFEHVASDDPRRRRWQERLNPIQRVVGVGCNVNRDTAALIRAAGFEFDPPPHQIETALPFSTYFPVIEGAARKPL